MFSAIGGVLGGIFGTKKAVDNLLDKDDGILVKAGGFLNDLHYSDAEKARDLPGLIKLRLERLRALHPFKIVQRIIAFAAMFAWVLLIINLFIAAWVNILNPDIYGLVNDELVVTTKGIHAFEFFMKIAISDVVFWPISLVFTLYCGGGFLESKNKGKG